jgi:hypothetical protein
MPIRSWESILNTTSNTAGIVHLPVRAGGRYITKLDVSTSAVRGGNFILPELPPDLLAFARHDGGTSVFLRFSDGHTATVDLARLGIDMSRLSLGTASASADGSAVEVRARHGKTVHIDSAVLRSYCDPEYAAELRQAIADVTAQ